LNNAPRAASRYPVRLVVHGTTAENPARFIRRAIRSRRRSRGERRGVVAFLANTESDHPRRKQSPVRYKGDKRVPCHPGSEMGASFGSNQSDECTSLRVRRPDAELVRGWWPPPPASKVARERDPGCGVLPAAPQSSRLARLELPGPPPPSADLPVRAAGLTARPTQQDSSLARAGISTAELAERGPAPDGRPHRPFWRWGCGSSHCRVALVPVRCRPPPGLRPDPCYGQPPRVSCRSCVTDDRFEDRSRLPSDGMVANLAGGSPTDQSGTPG